MQNKISILQFHVDDSATLLAIDKAGTVLEKQVVRDFSDLNSDQQLIVLIPGQHVLMSSVKLPKTNRRELIKAIPFALEEQVASDIDQLYFVLGEKEEHDQWVVAAIDKEIFEKYKQKLKSNQLSPLAIIPDFLVVPYTVGEWTIVVDNEMVQVRTGKQLGFSAEIKNLSLLLQLTGGHEQSVPKQITWYGKVDAPPIPTKIPITVRDNDEMTYAALIGELPFNLLPTKYRPQYTENKLKRYWRLAAYAGAAGIFVLFSSMFIQWAYWYKQANYLHQQISSAYQALFPRDTSENDVRSRMQNELNALLKANQENQFIQLVEQSAMVLQQHPQITVESLTYQNDQLVVELTADTLAGLEEVVRTMNQLGLQVKQNQTTHNGEKVLAEIMVK